MATPAPRRRTQEERREATRTALLDATVECLVQYGYANTTTARVADRAGVSRGAQIHYFASKAALVAGAVEHLAHRRIAEFARQVRRVPEGPDRMEKLLDMVWDAHAGELFDATLELWVAARTDPELHEHLVALERGVARSISLAAAEKLIAEAERPGFRGDLELALATARGLALLRIADGDNPRTVNRRWKAARSRLLLLLTTEPSGSS